MVIGGEAELGERSLTSRPTRAKIQLPFVKLIARFGNIVYLEQVGPLGTVPVAIFP
jgi:hypothetical protein